VLAYLIDRIEVAVRAQPILLLTVPVWVLWFIVGRDGLTTFLAALATLVVLIYAVRSHTTG
jgi:hypothetical protein